MDIHSLRKTFNTWLGLAGVASRIARELMRHSHTDLTMGVYTDPALFDLSAAVESPPAMHRTGASGVQQMSAPDQRAISRTRRHNPLGRMKKLRISRGFLESWGTRIRT